MDENKVKKLTMKVFELCLEINGLSARSQDITGNLPTAFFSFSGHISQISVDIHMSGWKVGTSPSEDIKLSAYLDNGAAGVEAMIAALEQIIERFERGK